MKPRMILLLVLALAVSSVRADDDAPAATPAAAISAAVRVAAVRRQTVSDVIRAYGRVAADPRQVHAVGLARGGQITEMYVGIGQRVVKGQPLLAFATSPEAAAAYRQALSALKMAQTQRRSVAQLLQQQLATQAQLAAADKSLADAQTTLTALQKNGAGMATERLKAPFDATVTAISVNSGDRVAPGAILMQLAKSGALRAVLGVEPADAIRIRPGMPVRIGAVFGHVQTESRVAQLAGAIDPQTQLVDTLVALPSSALLPGSAVRGDIRLAQYMATVVPRPAVLRDERGAYLFQVQNGKARRIGVKTGLEDAGIIAVSGSLIADEPVVVSGNYELRDGMAVRIVP